MCKICKKNTINKVINNVDYIFCPSCGFLSKAERHILNSNDEFLRYKNHQNNNEDYKKYQENFYHIIREFLGENVLDFGCGDGHVLANILAQNGHNSHYYDLYFYPQENYKKILYDAIILEEVIEHIREPLPVLLPLLSLLKNDGRLIIRTRFIPSDVFLNNWWYLRDITHISFFDMKTFKYLCQVLKMQIIYCNDKDIVILEKV